MPHNYTRANTWQGADSPRGVCRNCYPAFSRACVWSLRPRSWLSSVARPEIQLASTTVWDILPHLSRSAANSGVFDWNVLSFSPYVDLESTSAAVLFMDVRVT